MNVKYAFGQSENEEEKKERKYEIRSVAWNLEFMCQEQQILFILFFIFLKCKIATCGCCLRFLPFLPVPVCVSVSVSSI